MKKKTEVDKRFEPAWYEKKQGVTRRKKIRQAERKEISALKKETKEYFAKKTAEKKEQDALLKHNDTRASKKKRSQLSAKANLVVKDIDSLFDLSSTPQESRAILENLQEIISSSYPLNSKQRALLPKQIQALSHNLTDDRTSRKKGYMNGTETLSAYVHYFFWWNLVRLTRLFSNIDSSFFDFSDGDVCLDIGSGPLTVPIAMFLSRPELRNKKITWYCMDISSQALLTGENIFLSVASRLQCESWKIIRVKGALGESIKEKAKLVTCANMFNESSEDAGMPPEYLAKKSSEKLLAYLSDDDSARVLVIEPGVPKTARFVSLLRDAFLRKGFYPVSPCPHCEGCPMDGHRGGKWCNFSFSTDDAPKSLRKLSNEAHLPKERAVLSFVAVTRKTPQENQNANQQEEKELSFRIASDAIRLPGGKTGYYACSKLGLLLVVSSMPFSSGECLSVPMPRSVLTTDQKSGALILELN